MKYRYPALLVAAALALTGCTADPKPVSQPASNALDGVGPITFVTGKDSSGVQQGLLDKWNTEHPDQKVTLVELPAQADGQRQQLIQNAQTKSSSYGVVSLDVVWTAEFAANGWVEELPQSEFPLGQILPSLVAGVKYFDKMYAAPWGGGTALLYYRSDLLTKAGVQPPKTWAELDAACAKVLKLPEAKGVDCYGGQFNKYEGLTVNASEAINSAGGSVVGSDGKPTLNTPEAKEGLNFLVDGFKSGRIPKAAITWDEEAGRRAFQEGKLLFLRNWSYVYTLANKTDGSSKVAGKFGVAPIPGLKGPGKGTIGSNNLAISKYAKNKKTALDFIKWMTSQQTAKQLMVQSAQSPAYTAMYDDPDLVKQYAFMPMLKEGLMNAAPRPAVIKYGDATAAIQEEVSSALTGQKTSEQALSDLQQRLSGIVGK
ncbi:ABC transporter substrate-binding protein [Kribbella solani]|uniref:Multiple sugar transport system substrate-binding protein n=1 Tax=Kribbella solani TaxID=236067 RepID=A0A841DNE4_9ACTN|nr:ABC transporter substrate-binding protein [Kribbella solani]MBB5980072.1 multiple sugar transport system substrate-binding protein [Kribbella solani]